MHHRGYLTSGGSVVNDPSRRSDLIGELLYSEQRYNLRRVYVSRTWVAKLYDGRRYEAERRRDVIAAAIRSPE